MSIVHCNSPVGALSTSTFPHFTSEPMNLGSPNNANSYNTNSNFLPSFLMGDNSSSTPSSNSNHYLTAVKTSPFSLPHQSSAVNQRRLSDIKSSTTVNRTPRRLASPPIQSLWTSTRALTKQSDAILTDMRHSTPSNTACYSPMRQFNMIQQSLTSPSNSYQVPSTSKSFYSEHVPTDQRCTSKSFLNFPDDESNNWITVFGYPAAQAPSILQQFTHFGTIEKYLITNEGNWMHIKYENKIQAKCALNKNGRVFPGNVMIGVRRCTDLEVIQSTTAVVPQINHITSSEQFTPGIRSACGIFQSPRPVDSSLHDITNKRDTTMNQSFNIVSQTSYGLDKQSQLSRTSGLNRHSSMRPLVSTYRPPRTQVFPNTQKQLFKADNSKSSGILSKAMDFVFGWN